jgi:glycosyltransferase involved in cell wall biosynthesis
LTKTPAIDVLLAVYNGERYLSEFLDSLVAQTFSDFRLIVSDNKSTDSTLAILERYRDRINGGLIILVPPAQTVPAVQNFARVTEAASAPLVMYADADDVWYVDKIEKTLTAMRAAEHRYGVESPLLVHSDLTVVDQNLEPIHRSYWAYQNIDPTRVRLSQIVMRNCVTGCTVMMNRALLALTRPIPEQALMHDYWCALSAASFGNIVSVAEPLIAYRQHGRNDTGASSWGIRFVLQRARVLFSARGPRYRIRGKIAQAEAFLKLHGKELGLKDREIMEAFSTLPKANALERRMRIVRFGLWDDGFLRNIGIFLVL